VNYDFEFHDLDYTFAQANEASVSLSAWAD
jgi:hypothetical protein